MTRKDYQLIADAVKKSTATVMPAHLHCAQRVALNIADALQADNPRFNREKFIKACGINE